MLIIVLIAEVLHNYNKDILLNSKPQENTHTALHNIHLLDFLVVFLVAALLPLVVLGFLLPFGGPCTIYNYFKTCVIFHDYRYLRHHLRQKR